MRLRPKIEILQREGLLESRNDLNLTRGSRVFFFVVSERYVHREEREASLRVLFEKGYEMPISFC